MSDTERVLQALEDENFRKLFLDYVNEISDPSQRDIYEKEIQQLEKQSGNHVTFLNPEPCFVIKTQFLRNNEKVFVNVCTSKHVQPTTQKETLNNGKKGTNFSIPYSLSKPRNDLDKQGKACQVIDCIFHTETIKRSSDNPRFKELVIQTALDATESQLKQPLQKNMYKLPKMKSKGLVRDLIIREKDVYEKDTENSMEFLKDLLAQSENKENATLNSKSNTEKTSQQTKTPPLIQEIKTTTNSVNPTSLVVQTPKYRIIHQEKMLIHEHTVANPSPIITKKRPHSLLIKIELPKVKSVQEIDIDLQSKSLKLNVKDLYELNVDLPYEVNEDDASAKFMKANAVLEVSVPVREREIPVNAENLELETRVDQSNEEDEKPATSDEREQPMPLIDDERESSAVDQDSLIPEAEIASESGPIQKMEENENRVFEKPNVPAEAIQEWKRPDEADKPDILKSPDIKPDIAVESPDITPEVVLNQVSLDPDTYLDQNTVLNLWMSELD